jgi:hypothetical protein
VGFATCNKRFVYIFLNFDVSQMCSEAKSMASDYAINGKIYTIHNTSLNTPWIIHRDEEVFEYKYSNRFKKYLNTLLRIHENWYSNTVFEY